MTSEDGNPNRSTTVENVKPGTIVDKKVDEADIDQHLKTEEFKCPYYATTGCDETFPTYESAQAHMSKNCSTSRLHKMGATSYIRKCYIENFAADASHLTRAQRRTVFHSKITLEVVEIPDGMPMKRLDSERKFQIGFAIKTKRVGVRLIKKHWEFLTEIFIEGEKDPGSKKSAKQALEILKAKRDESGALFFDPTTEWISQNQIRTAFGTIKKKMKNIGQGKLAEELSNDATVAPEILEAQLEEIDAEENAQIAHEVGRAFQGDVEQPVDEQCHPVVVRTILKLKLKYFSLTIHVFSGW